MSAAYKFVHWGEDHYDPRYALVERRQIPVAMPETFQFENVTVDEYESNNSPSPPRPRSRRPRLSVPPPPPVTSAVPKRRYRTSHISVDTPWSALTWIAKANKAEMLKILEEGGEDTSLVSDWKSTDIADYVVGVQERRAAERQAAAEAEANINYNEEAISADAEAGAPVIRTKANLNRARDAWAKNLEATKLSASDIDDLRMGRDKHLPTLTVERARFYLVAIKRQVFVDTRDLTHSKHNSIDISEDESSDGFDPLRGDTIIRDHTGIVFSYDIQILIRDIVRSREVIRWSRIQPLALEDAERQELLDAEKIHADLCGKLIAAVAVRIEDWESDGTEEAMRLVHEVFGLAKPSAVDGDMT